MLYFGIRFKGYRPYNNIGISPPDRGLYFQNNSIAYTDDFFGVPKKPISESSGLTVELVLECEDFENSAFRYILNVNNGYDNNQLLLGQWQHWLVIMNGDDYDGKQGVPKIYVDVGDLEYTRVFFLITSGKEGTTVYQDGVMVKSNKNLHLFYPTQPHPARLILGNSAYGKHSWQGTIAEISLYDYAMNGAEAQAFYRNWATGSGIDFVDQVFEPKIFYVFDQLPGERLIPNRVGDAYPLYIPKYIIYLKRSILGWPRFSGGAKRILFFDMILNLIGFMPLGFLLCAILSRFQGRLGMLPYYWGSVGVALLFSFSLEIAQSWIPSRDSSLADLLLNTFGAAIGAGCFCWLKLKTTILDE